jgi:hypothetical protein
MQRQAGEALQIATESNAELVQRIEASNQHLCERVDAVDAKLAKVLDDKVMDWSPVFQKLSDEFTHNVQEQQRSIENQFRQTLLAVARHSGVPVGGINTAIPPSPRETSSDK